MWLGMTSTPLRCEYDCRQMPVHTQTAGCDVARVVIQFLGREQAAKRRYCKRFAIQPSLGAFVAAGRNPGTDIIRSYRDIQTALFCGNWVENFGKQMFYLEIDK